MIRPSGWIDTSRNGENVPIQFSAPSSYGFAPTMLSTDFPIGIVPMNVTAHQVAQRQADFESAAAASFFAGPIADCHVLNDSASFFSFTDGARKGYELLLIHNQLLYHVVLVGNGGLSDQAVHDYMAVLGSWAWKA